MKHRDRLLVPNIDDGLYYIDLADTRGKTEFKIDKSLLKDEKTRL